MVWAEAEKENRNHERHKRNIRIKIEHESSEYGERQKMPPRAGLERQRTGALQDAGAIFESLIGRMLNTQIPGFGVVCGFHGTGFQFVGRALPSLVYSPFRPLVSRKPARVTKLAGMGFGFGAEGGALVQAWPAFHAAA